MQVSPSFTPLPSLLGGVIIGASASALLLTHGKILGISGILYSSHHPETPARNRTWRLSFLSGLLATGSYLAASFPAVFGTAIGTTPPLLPIAAAGAIVGFGTKLGSGCTSGHGVCGLPRFSLRSLVAVGTFMASAAVTASVVGLRTGPLAAAGSAMAVPIATSYGAPLALALALVALFWPGDSTPLMDKAVAWGIGALFAAGLGLSGMLNPGKVLGFLSPYAVVGGWDPSLAFVMGGAVAVNLVLFPLIMRRGKTLDGRPLDVPTNSTIDAKLVVGSSLFGLGWGLAGVCPGPALVTLGVSSPAAFTFVGSLLAGQFLFRIIL